MASQNRGTSSPAFENFSLYAILRDIGLGLRIYVPACSYYLDHGTTAALLSYPILATVTENRLAANIQHLRCSTC